jgi:hypothetical protein
MALHDGADDVVEQGLVVWLIGVEARRRGDCIEESRQAECAAAWHSAVTVGVVPPSSSDVVPTTKSPRSASVTCGPNSGDGSKVAWDAGRQREHGEATRPVQRMPACSGSGVGPHGRHARVVFLADDPAEAPGHGGGFNISHRPRSFTLVAIWL